MILSTEYETFRKEGLSVISEKVYRISELVQMVLKDANDQNLAVACGYCSDNKGLSMSIMLSICYGCYPKLKDEEDDESWEVIDALPKPCFVHNVESRVRLIDVTSSPDELILVKNTLYNEDVPTYLDSTWEKNMPTMHTAVNTIAKVARDAIVENSNGNSEGTFKNTKHDATYKWHARIRLQSTYLHHYAMNSRTQTREK